VKIVEVKQDKQEKADEPKKEESKPQEDLKN
jgi:hypothetical protein